MQRPFFITGLPRSRTAWMANWLTTDRSVCYHDRPAEQKLIESGPCYTGFSGSELIFQFDHLREEYPLAPWLVIRRDLNAARASFEKFAKTSLLDWVERDQKLDLIEKHPRVRSVTFRELDREALAPGIWNFLLPGLFCDIERWRLLSEFNVQQIFEKGVNRWAQAQH